MRSPTNDELFKISSGIMFLCVVPVLAGCVIALVIATKHPERIRRYDLVQTIGNETDTMDRGLTIMDCARRLPELRNSGLHVDCKNQ